MKKNVNTCILLFVKYPEKGKVKQRLSVDIDDDIVVDLYRCFVKDTLATVKKINAQLFVCFYPIKARKKIQKWLGTTILFLPQNGTNFGERMKNCFINVFEKGFQQAILIGSDSPDLPIKHIEQAFHLLQANDIIIGPTVDGGYYLIGFHKNTFTSSVFDNIHWGTQMVFKETVFEINQAHRSFSLLPIWNDIDTIDDLKFLIKRAEKTSFKSSQTMRYLYKNNIRLESDDEGKTTK